jgi:hypothetical protein
MTQKTHHTIDEKSWCIVVVVEVGAEKRAVLLLR